MFDQHDVTRQIRSPLRHQNYFSPGSTTPYRLVGPITREPYLWQGIVFCRFNYGCQFFTWCNTHYISQSDARPAKILCQKDD